MKIALRSGALAAFALSRLSATLPATAGPADHVYSPVVEEGEREVEFQSGRSKARDGTRASAHSLALGWGATSWWSTEVAAKWHQQTGESFGFDAWEWENRFQLAPTGKYPIDVGLLLEIERPRDRSEGYEIKWGPLLQAELSPSVQANLNLLLEKHVRVSGGGAAELGYQWQLKYRWQPVLEFGLQGFGDVGPWKDWEPASEQPHVAGPAVFGRFKVGAQHIHYEAAMLFGLSDRAPRHTLRLQTEFEF